MSIRREPTYLSTDVWRACWLLSKWRSDEARTITVDEMADGILRDSIKDKYPQLFEHQKKVESMEKELLKDLQ
jgi:hypothetical protein